MTPGPPAEDRFAACRRAMVDEQIRQRGVTDSRVLAAMEAVPRHAFVGQEHVEDAYADHPLPIGCGQTISQPYMVARMTELCQVSSGDRVLEVGAGSGYHSAILASLCRQVYATEIIADLVYRAREALLTAGFDNVQVALRDGGLGWEEHAPFDAIVVAAGAPDVPAPLLDQLADGGRLVIPVGGRGLQFLKVVIRNGSALETHVDTACRFVDLRGEHGWSAL